MAITNITINFTPCPDPPVGGYNIEYRVVGDVSYIDGGNYSTSPAIIPVSYPDGTQFEGIVHSPCGDVVWSTVVAPPDDGCGCRFGYPGEDELAGENRQFDVTGAYTFVFTGSSGITLQVNNSNGIPLYALSSGGSSAVVGENTSNSTGVAGFAVSGTGVYAQSNSGAGLWALTTTGFTAGIFQVNPATVDSIQNVVRLNRNTSGTAADGIGGSLEYYTEDDSGSLQLSTSIVSDWDIAAAGTRRSEFYITGVDNAVTQTLFMLSGTGQGRLNKYGVGTFLNDPVYGLGVLADGTIVEYDPAAGGGSGSGASMFRFGYITEDDTAGEDRVFQLGTDYQVRFNGSVPGATKDSMFKVTNAADEGTSIYGVSTGADGVAVRGQADGVAGLFISVNDSGVTAQSTNGPGALIASTNAIGAQISTDSGSYSLEARTTSTVDNNTVHTNFLLNAISTITPVADGFGQSLDFQTNTTDLATTRISNQIISSWITADDATGQSLLTLTGVNAGSLQNLLFIVGDGIFLLPLGLNDYADDTAAAAGTPVIPVGGLYRNGSAVMIRVT